ncbi:MAG: hypothetical protein WDN26_08970 [Chitinophagaceae bacterium]
MERPRLMDRIRELIPAHDNTHMACFNVTAYERTLATRLQIPILAAILIYASWEVKAIAERFSGMRFNGSAGF